VKGVAAGLAAAANIDPTLVRILFAVAGLSGWGVVAYIVLCFVMKDESAGEPARELPHDQRLFLRIALGIAGVISVGRMFDGWPFGDGRGGPGWGLVLIGVGAAVLWTRRDSNPPGYPAAGYPGDGQASQPWMPPVSSPLGSAINWRTTGHDLLRLFGAFVAIGAFLVLANGAILVASGVASMRWPALPAVIGVVGITVLVAAVVKRARPAGLIAAIAVLGVAGVLALGLTSLSGPSGDRTVVVGAGEPLTKSYRHGVGRLVLDLTSVELGPEPTLVEARVAMGKLRVVVPADAVVRVNARLGAGSAHLLGTQQRGPGIDVTRVSDLGPPVNLVIDAKVGLGKIEVERAPERQHATRCEVPTNGVITEGHPVTCVRPEALEGAPMDCAVAVVAEFSSDYGKGQCQRSGVPFPVALSSFTVKCRFTAASGSTSRCSSLPPDQLAKLARLAQSTSTTASTTAPTTSTTPSSAPAAPSGAVVCTPPDASGRFSCAPSSPPAAP